MLHQAELLIIFPRKRLKKIYGFDVFSGLPETWRTGFQAGVFGRQDLPEVNSNVELVVGLFENTLDAFLEKYRQPVSLLHIDCDLYSATDTIFKKLGELIQSGTVIVFDEYFNYPGWQHHEFRAFQEFVEHKKIKYRYDSFVYKQSEEPVYGAKEVDMINSQNKLFVVKE